MQGMTNQDLTKKVCALTVPYPGVRQWLEHGHRERLWDLRVIDTNQPLEVPDAELYLLGAWSNAYLGIIDRIRKQDPKKRFAVAWSSSPGEMGTTHIEIAYALSISRNGKDAPRIDAWACLHPDLVPHFPNAIHLPGPIHIETDRSIPFTKRTGVFFFAPATTKKNIFPQLLAVKRFQDQKPGDPDRRLYTNLADYAPIMKGYGIDYEIVPWLDRAEFMQRISHARLAMISSIYESHSYAAVDFMSQGVPVVGSPTIPWLPKAWMAEPNSPESMVRVMTQLWDDPRPHPRLHLEAVASNKNREARLAVERLAAGDWDTGGENKSPPLNQEQPIA